MAMPCAVAGSLKAGKLKQVMVVMCEAKKRFDCLNAGHKSWAHMEAPIWLYGEGEKGRRRVGERNLQRRMGKSQHLTS